jgi:hypothetical protein
LIEKNDYHESSATLQEETLPHEQSTAFFDRHGHVDQCNDDQIADGMIFVDDDEDSTFHIGIPEPQSEKTLYTKEKRLNSVMLQK